MPDLLQFAFSTRFHASLLTIFTICQLPASAQDSLTATEIIDKSIAFCGGMENIERIKTVAMEYDLLTQDREHISYIIKREEARKYMESMLSMKHQSSSKHFDGKTLEITEGEKTVTVNPPEPDERMVLKTFSLPQVGYRQLGYKLERMEDQDIGKFSCYVVFATSPGNSYGTVNYFDKKDFRLLMTIFPNGNRLLYIKHEFRQNVLFHTQIMSTGKKSPTMVFRLRNMEINPEIDPLWFAPGRAADEDVPEYVKTGNFILNSEIILKRKEALEIEMNPETGEEHKSALAWFNKHTYALVRVAESGNEPAGKQHDKLVKIIGWNKERHICHIYSNASGYTAEYMNKKQ